MAIIFSVAFAAIAIIASGGETRFIAFLEDEDEGFTSLLDSFGNTLNALFAALLISLAEFGYVVYRMTASFSHESKAFMAVFIFVLCYALLSAKLIGSDAIMFAKKRAKFVLDEEKHHQAENK